MATIEERANLAAWQIYEEIDLSKHSVDRVAEIIEEKIREQKAIDEEEIRQLHSIMEKSADKPMSWEEYCNKNPITDGACYIDDSSIITPILDSHPKDVDNDINVMTKELCKAFLAYMKLIQLRDAWVKEYGKTECYYKIASENDVIMCKSCDYFVYGLSFPTKDITDEFMHTFEDLLEVAKPLL